MIKECEKLIKEMSDKFKEIEKNINSKTGISFNKFFDEQEIYMRKLVYLCYEYAKIKENGFFELTPVFLKKLVQFLKRNNEISILLYDNNIDIVNFEEHHKYLDKILSILFDENTNEYISNFIYDWDYCESSPQVICWKENNEDFLFIVKDINTLCEYLSTTKNINDLYYQQRYWEDINKLENKIKDARLILESKKSEKDCSFLENLTYKSFSCHVEDLEKQLKDLIV